MTKTIKLDEPVYDRLEKFRGKRETFSGAVDRLMTIVNVLATLSTTIEGTMQYAEWNKKRLEDEKAENVSGDSAKVPDVQSGEMETRDTSLQAQDV